MDMTDINSLIESMIEEELNLVLEIDPNYLKGLSGREREEREKEIKSRSKKDSSDPSAYKPFKTDSTPSGKPRTPKKKSVWTKKAEKMGFGPKKEELMLDGESQELVESLISALVQEVLLEKKRNNVTKALKNKSEKSGAPMSALRAIYNKGLAAWRTGHRPGASQHAWAMARVNSVLAGGPARKVDATQWKQIQKHRGKKRKKK